MRAFTGLFEKLDSTTSTKQKVLAMEQYFESASDSDAAWAVYFMSGRRIKRLVPRKLLKHWLIDVCEYDEWIIDDCYESVGDLAETIALLVPPVHGENSHGAILEGSSTEWIEQKILTLRDLPEDKQAEIVKSWWLQLPTSVCFTVTKLLTGALRVGVSQLLVARALANHAKLDRTVILHRLMGDWTPSATFFQMLVHPETSTEDISRPYPFYLASPLDKAVEQLGEIEDWQAEWKWDGIRAQAIRRDGEVFIWSRGEELVTDTFPEISQALNACPNGTVLDGELLVWKDNQVGSFNELQRRLGRKGVSKKLLSEVPIKFHVYDLLEHEGKDIREKPLSYRSNCLSRLVDNLNSTLISMSHSLDFESWDDLAKLRKSARRQRVEGLMLKKRDGSYETGRKKGAWWKWKVDPMSIDAVLLYAQAGHGKRASLFTDYTFAVWQGDSLLPVAKAYSGLDNKEINQLDKWIRGNTIEKFGPVRSVKIEHVFEIGFEGIAESSRHKSGVALRFPRILRWRQDMRASDANTLDMVKALLKVYEAEPP